MAYSYRIRSCGSDPIAGRSNDAGTAARLAVSFGTPIMTPGTVTGNSLMISREFLYPNLTEILKLLLNRRFSPIWSFLQRAQDRR